MIDRTVVTRPPLFATTRWSLVAAAGSGGSTDALEDLCRIYWFPIYAVVRKSGKSRDDAMDLTQGFFEKLLEKRWLDIADDSRGRFRSFLLTALKRYLANEWHRGQRPKAEAPGVPTSCSTGAGRSRCWTPRWPGSKRSIAMPAVRKSSPG
jgi:RNA polymerase sigma-70 factor (ECF subfamily)